jgi:hypothetical protein
MTIRFVASHAAPKRTEIANSDKTVTVDEDVRNRKDDIQGSESDTGILCKNMKFNMLFANRLIR